MKSLLMIALLILTGFFALSAHGAERGLFSFARGSEVITPSFPLDHGLEKSLLESLGIQKLSQEAPDFTLINQGGGKISLKDYRGKVVIINIWATWCVPCKEEFPLFEKMYRRIMEKNAVFLPIAMDIKATQDEINKFAEEQAATFPVYLASLGNITSKYWAWGVPVTYFIDKKGWIAGRAIGPRDWGSDKVNDLINALLGEK